MQLGSQHGAGFVPHFHLLGIPVVVRPWFVLTAFVFASSAKSWGQALGVGALFSISLLLHELGHALTSKSLGYKPLIELRAMGGVTWFLTGRPDKPPHSLMIALSGPAVSVALALVGYAIERQTAEGYMHSAGVWIAGMNGLWAVINMLPILPLDGGEALLAIGSSWFGRRAASPMRLWSIATSMVVAIAGFVHAMPIVGVIGLGFAMSNYVGWKNADALAMLERASRDAAVVLAGAEQRLAAGDGQGAAQLAESVLRGPLLPPERLQAARLLCFALVVDEQWGRYARVMDAFGVMLSDEDLQKIETALISLERESELRRLRELRVMRGAPDIFG